MVKTSHCKDFIPHPPLQFTVPLLTTKVFSCTAVLYCCTAAFETVNVPMQIK